ncbi:MAG: ankyrin repeat domain-containing protein [Blastocatellia bacterium]
MAGLSKLIGEVLDGKYHLDKRLGQGGMGAVFLATHLGTKRPVALKVIAPQFMANEEVGERFRREAEAAGRLRHPNVVNVTDFGVAIVGRQRVAYLVMEYLDGGSLGQMIKEKGALPLALVVDIVEQICLAIGNAHHQGVIHRDLKPDNILLQPDGRGGYIVKVLDFGLAKLRDASATEDTVTADGPAVEPAARAISNTIRQVAATQPHYKEEEAQTRIQAPAASEIETATQIHTATTVQEDQTRILDHDTDENVEAATQIQPDEDGATRIQPDSFTGNSSRPEGMTSGLGFTVSPASDITRVGSVLGTPLYMSPEQCRSESLDPRSDIYSLGVIVYQMLAGTTPFSGGMTELITKHCDELPPSLKDKRRDIPVSLAEQVMSALAKKPEDRPRTAEAFASAVRATAEGETEILRQAKSYYYTSQREFFLLSLFIYLPFAVVAMSLSIGLDSILSRSQPASLLFGAFLFLLVLFASRLNTAACALVIKEKRLMLTANVKLNVVLRSFAKRVAAVSSTTALSYLRILFNLLKFVTPGIRAFVDNSLFPSVVMMEDKRGAEALDRSRLLVRPLRTVAVALATRDFGISLASLIFFPFISMLMAMFFGGTRNDALKVLMVPMMRNFITGYCWFILIIMHTVYSAVPLAALYFKARQASGERVDETTSRDWQGEDKKRTDKMSKATVLWFAGPLVMLGLMVFSSVANIGWSSEDSFVDSVRKGRVTTVKRMLAHGASANETRFNVSALMYAAKDGHTDIVRELLAAGAKLNAKDNDGDTPLMYAAIDNRVEIVKDLLTAGAEVNAKNNLGTTPLIAAAIRGRSEPVKALLAAGADYQVKDNTGKTALMYAEAEGHAEVVQMLKAAEAE